MNRNQLQVKFVAKQEKYVVPDIYIGIDAQSTTEDLNVTVNQLLNPDVLPEKLLRFEFFVLGEILKVQLDEHLKDKDVDEDSEIVVEFVEKLPAPSVGEQLLHDDWVGAVRALNNDLILTGSYDGNANLWGSDGRLLRVIPAHQQSIKSVAWLKGDNEAEKRFVTSSDDGTCIMWSWIASEADIKQFEGITDKKNEIELGVVKMLHTCPMPELSKDSKNSTRPRNVQTVMANPDKKFFATGSMDCAVNIWSSESCESNSKVGEQVKNKGKKKRKIETAEQRLPVQTLESHTDTVTGVDWISEKEICSCSVDHSLRIWDVHAAKMLSSISSSKEIFGLSFSPINRTIITGSSDRHIRLYDPRITTGSVVQRTFTSHTNSVYCVNWSTDDGNLFLSGSYDCVAKLWDIRSPKASLYDMRGQDDRILCCDWSVPSMMLVGGVDKRLRIFSKSGTNIF